MPSYRARSAAVMPLLPVRGEAGTARVIALGGLVIADGGATAPERGGYGTAAMAKFAIANPTDREITFGVLGLELVSIPHRAAMAVTGMRCDLVAEPTIVPAGARRTLTVFGRLDEGIRLGVTYHHEAIFCVRGDYAAVAAGALWFRG